MPNSGPADAASGRSKDADERCPFSNASSSSCKDVAVPPPPAASGLWRSSVSSLRRFSRLAMSRAALHNTDHLPQLEQCILPLPTSSSELASDVAGGSSSSSSSSSSTAAAAEVQTAAAALRSAPQRLWRSLSHALSPKKKRQPPPSKLQPPPPSAGSARGKQQPAKRSTSRLLRRAADVAARRRTSPTLPLLGLGNAKLGQQQQQQQQRRRRTVSAFEATGRENIRMQLGPFAWCGSITRFKMLVLSEKIHEQELKAVQEQGVAETDWVSSPAWEEDFSTVNAKYAVATRQKLFWWGGALTHLQQQACKEEEQEAQQQQLCDGSDADEDCKEPSSPAEAAVRVVFTA